MTPEDPSTVSKGRILVVDDTGFNRILVEKCLAREGYEVVQASGGNEALKKLSSQRFHLVITDLMMPDLDGLKLFEACKAARFEDQHGRIPCPPFILCTAIQERELVENAVSAGFADVILKPIEPERLRTAVKKHAATSWDRIPVSFAGVHAVTLAALAELTASSPEAAAQTVIEMLSLADFGDEVKSLDDLKSFLRKRLAPEDDPSSAEMDQGTADGSEA